MSNIISTDGNLEESLKILLNNLDIYNYETSFYEGTAPGGNFLGLIAKAEVRGEDELGRNKFYNFIIKQAPKSETFRSFVPVHKVYKREAFLYNQVFSEFLQLQLDNDIPKPFCPIPKLYFSNNAVNNEILIMDDMKQFGFVNRDRQETLDYEHIVFILKEIGKFHALSFALRDQKPEVFKMLAQDLEDVYFDKPINSDLHKTIRYMADRALKSLDPIKHEVAYKKFQNYQKSMTEKAIKAVSSKSAGKYSVITHGDFWVNNLLFKYENHQAMSKLQELCMLDWQLSRLGSPAIDLSYFFFLCTDTETRDKHYNTFLDIYYKSLANFLQLLGSDPEKLFPFSMLQDHLKRFSLYGLYMGTWVLSVLTSDADEIPDMEQLDGCQSLSDEFQFETKDVEKFHNRIRGVILHMVKHDYDF